MQPAAEIPVQKVIQDRKVRRGRRVHKACKVSLVPKANRDLKDHRGRRALLDRRVIQASQAVDLFRQMALSVVR